MVVDTSAILAILQQEPEAQTFSELIQDALSRHVSAVSVLEAGIILLRRYGAEGARDLDIFLSAAELEIGPFDQEQSEIARDAFDRYGKGRHPARLNFGDCAVYALAATRAEPLLFKGDDFSATDLEAYSSSR